MIQSVLVREDTVNFFIDQKMNIRFLSLFGFSSAVFSSPFFVFRCMDALEIQKENILRRFCNVHINRFGENRILLYQNINAQYVMKKNLHSMMVVCAGLILACCNQQMGTEDYQSTIVNEDGTVTFQYKNDNAKEVFVDVQFAGKNKMKRDSLSGLWTVTLGPAAPDMYPYNFQVDGVGVMDPMCDQYFPNEGFKNSLLEISSNDGSLPHDINNVPHGRMESVHY